MDPDSVIGNRIMGFAYLYKQQFAEATRHLEFASKLSNYAAFNQVDLINLYTTKGAFEQANAIMEELRSRLNDLSETTMSNHLNFHLNAMALFCNISCNCCAWLKNH